MYVGKVRCTFVNLYDSTERREQGATSGGAKTLASVHKMDYPEDAFCYEGKETPSGRIPVSLSEDILDKLPYLSEHQVFVDAKQVVWEEVEDVDIIDPEEQEYEDMNKNIIIGAAAILGLLLLTK